MATEDRSGARALPRMAGNLRVEGGEPQPLRVEVLNEDGVVVGRGMLHVEGAGPVIFIPTQ